MSNPLFIQKINETLAGVFTQAGVRIFGLAETVVRNTGDVDQFFPALVIGDEAQYIGLDDAYPMTIYHKANSIVISDKQNSGFGDSKALKLYSYANVMVVAYNSTLFSLTQDQVMLIVEANLPDVIKVKEYRQVNVRTESAVLNSLSVFNSEYKGADTGIPLNFRLMAIYYRVESLFDKQCLPKCP